MNDIPPVLRAEPLGDDRWTLPHPEADPEGRDVVFSGQLLAQMMMVSVASGGGDKEVKSIHAIFARAGRYSAGPLVYRVEHLHAGRTWASDTVTVCQGDRVLARGLVLLNSVEPDLVRHGPAMPQVRGPEECGPIPAGAAFPGVEVRAVDQLTGAPGARPEIRMWVRGPKTLPSTAANQAVVAWSQPGLVIGAALRPHADVVDLRDAHRSISTGVIAHTAHFHDEPDPGDWLLFIHEGTYAGRGRIFGRGAVFTRDGVLVSTFSQDSMARRADAPLDPASAL
jgi:acyl-CoA thioesterase-2